MEADPTLYNVEAVIHNTNVVKTSRIFTSLVAGCAVGILGITGWWAGLLCYLVVTLLTSFLLALKANFQYKPYFFDANGPLFDGLGKGVMTYIMFWTLLYDVTHVYSSGG